MPSNIKVLLVDDNPMILEMLRRYGSIEAANARAHEYADAARKAICHFPDSDIKRALLWAPEYVVAREK